MVESVSFPTPPMWNLFSWKLLGNNNGYTSDKPQIAVSSYYNT